MNLDELRKLMHKINHGAPDSGVGRADHVNLQDGIRYDVDGMPLAVGEDTKIPLKPFNPLDDPEAYDVSLELPDIDDNQDTINFWRAHQRRDDIADD
ncbi:hypothetical protein [Mycobacteroides abscessus]|uniref:hypothetical protein n=1 Tax=Mycobacteroides abscessus TaxID=36809 RepID=UPI0009A7532E|nr:hypothetical protein [Mycobacteroides abscessus]SKI02268.1 Uncharacterised protein [Mycobacteroides abscessus subsp. massiliense]SKL84918.1 Uncharacterised protein [Mycobacteroides abscessus subsp. massiliense]